MSSSMSTTRSPATSRTISAASSSGDLTVSVGGEIGEVGARTALSRNCHAFMQGTSGRSECWTPRAVGISKISVQTGTSHGGIVLPTGRLSR